ncbi:MAG: BtpA/SgcQ family protein [Candidatus Hodarchaeales archaeon]|jgi:membrane complex biogenesis BtpA family protein
MSNTSRTVWGMLHLPALPGSSNNKLSIKEITKFVLSDAQILYDTGIRNMVIENLGDAPYYKYNEKHHISSFMTKIGIEIIQKFPEVSLGINVLRNDAYSSLAIGKALESNCKFIRINVLTGAYITDQGIIEGEAAKISDYRRKIHATDIQIWSDVRVKHASPIVIRPLEDEIKENLERAGASKIILSGSMTGKKVDMAVLEEVNQIISVDKIVIGSGITPENFSDYKSLASNFIVGSSLKKDNIISNPIDKDKVNQLLKEL